MITVLPRLKPPGMEGVLNGRLPSSMLTTVVLEGSDFLCHPQFARAANALKHDMFVATGWHLAQVGGYRSYTQQVNLLQARYRRCASGTRYWDGSWWCKFTGATVATPGTSDHGWGLAVDGAVFNPVNPSVPLAVASKPVVWNWLESHLINYGLCWAWRPTASQPKGAEPWHWHLFEMGASAVLAFEGSGPPPSPPPPPPPPPEIIWDPANGHYSLWPLGPKPDLDLGSTGDAVKYLQGVMKNEVSRFAAWFVGQAATNVHPSGNPAARGMYLAACRDSCAALAVDGNYGQVTADAVGFMQEAFTWSAYDGQHVGALTPDKKVGSQQTWPFIDHLADKIWY